MDLNVDFVSAYFSKVFSNELMEENQEILTRQEKYDCLFRLYQYAKTKKLPESLISNLLHEILALSIKLDDYKQDLFKEYLKLPLERNNYLKKEEVQTKQKLTNYTIWNKCLDNIQKETKTRYEATSWNQVNDKDDVIPTYLGYIAYTNKGGALGSLNLYKNDFKEEYLRNIEKMMLVYRSDKGMVDMDKAVSPEFFKTMADQVFIRFKESNEEQF